MSDMPSPTAARLQLVVHDGHPRDPFGPSLLELSKTKEKGRHPQNRVIGDQLVSVDPLVQRHDVRRRLGLLAAVVDQAAPRRTDEVRPVHGPGFRELEVGPAGLGVRCLGAADRQPNGFAERGGDANGLHRGLPAWRQEVTRARSP